MEKTTIEQSEHLVELGIDPWSADMWYECHVFPGSENIYTVSQTKGPGDNEIPAWTPTALMNVLPRGKQYTWILSCVDGTYSICFYDHKYDEDESIPKEDRPFQYFYSDNLLDAVYKLVCWVLENGYPLMDN